MTREEHIAALEKFRDGILSGGISVPYDDLMIALDASIAALRGPEPDPETGLVPCGCGGKGLFEGAYMDEEVPSSYRVCLSCAECGMSTAEYEQEAMRAWNTAMGRRRKN